MIIGKNTLGEDIELSNLSYTNKDFQSIFPELLELIKELTYRWDPTISNESDPGVILLKVNAILADKNNYNIDKNVLECFPLSVTQRQNAYQLFEQLGYYMKQYHAAGSTRQIVTLPDGITRKTAFKDGTEVIYFSWNGDTNVDYQEYEIPLFSMVSDAENNIIYTIVDSVLIRNNTANQVGAKALQGSKIEYTINGNKKIRFSNLDSNRRLYFNDINVAENGIFIANYANGVVGDYFAWIKVDNIEVEPISPTDKYYKFGLSQDLNSCYIEFPENANELIGEGISIVYIKTDGENGNIPAGTINQGYQIGDITSNYDPSNPVSVPFSDNIKVTNLSAIRNGTNPESIDDAYRNYTRTVGTFDTLVTLRDYLNAALRTNDASNGFVCDRTNDPQDTIKVMTQLNGLDVAKTFVRTNSYSGDNEPTMTAFDLKFYLLSSVAGNVDTSTKYDTTFDMYATSGELYPIEQQIEELKCIQHDYKYISDDDSDNICFLRNEYPIKCKIIPQYSITRVQRDQIQKNIEHAIYDGFNSRNVVFGQEISYEKLYDTILNADNRIKTIFLDDLSYETYSYSYVGGQWERELVSVIPETFAPGALSDKQLGIYARSVLAGNTQLLVHDKSLNYAVNQNGNLYGDIKKVTTNADGICTVLSGGDYQYSYVVKDNELFQATTENYIADVTYSSYVRYKANFDVGTNTVHTLEPGETLIFAYKDADDLPYIRKPYGVGTIVKTYSVPITNNYSSVGDDPVDWKTLSSSGKIDILKENTQNITKTNLLYWVTNNISDGRCVLFEAGQSEKVLEENEFLFVSYAQSNELSILYSGTRITRANTQYELSCEYIAEIATEVFENGANALNGLWVSGVELTATELKIVSAGPGSVIQFKLADGATLPSNRLTYNSVSLSAIQIDGSESLETTDWKARLLLTIDTTETTSQKLLSGQSIVVVDKMDSTPRTISGGDGVNVETSLPLSVLGGENINVSYVSESGTQYIDFYAYTSVEPTLDDQSYSVELQNDGSYKVTIPVDSSGGWIDFNNIKLPKGKYILPITNLSQTIGELMVDTNVKSANTINRVNPNQYVVGTFYYVIDNESDDVNSIMVHIGDREDTTKIATAYIGNIVKYTLDPAYENILNKVIALDETHSFNYVYEVPNDAEIENPLIANSFFDVNHIYNPYTIGKVSSISLTTTNVTK